MIAELVLAAGLALLTQAEPPQGFRGDGSGRYPRATPPVEWGDAKNVLWTTKIGPNKYSSPIVVDGKIFLVAEPAWLFCVNADDGKILWQKSNDYADLPEKPEGKRGSGDAGNTTPTPVSDGLFVYAVFGTGIVACYDLKGERQWIHWFSQKPATEYGRASSPVLGGGKLLVTLSSLLALDPRTGKEVWRNKDVPECYGTPVVTAIRGVEVAVMPSGQIVRLHDGAILAADLGGLKFASPVVQDGTVYLMQAGSSAKRLSAAAPDKWEAGQVWEQELEATFYASALYHQGLIYVVSNQGNFYVIDSKDGKILVTRELEMLTNPDRPDLKSAPNLYPSLALAGNRLYLLNDLGDALVLEPGREFKEVRRNHLGDGHGGSPVFDGKRLYLRGSQNLYCVGEK